MVVAGTFHEVWGGKIAEKSGIGLTWGMVIVYAGVIFAHLLAFFLLRKLVGEKLAESHSFGRGERLFGMLACLVRYGCMALACLAFVNAPAYSTAELAAAWRSPPPAMSGKIRSPSFAQIQELLMYDSCTGRYVREHLTAFLITPVPEPKVAVPKPRDTRAKKIEKEIERTLEK